MKLRFRTLLAGLGALCLLLGTAFPASAEVGNEGDLALGVERVFGLVKSTRDIDDEESSVTSLSLLYPNTNVVYSRPRVAIDYFVIDHVSVGGSLGFHTWSPSEGDNGGSGWLFSPRAGYLASLGKTVALWPRVGFTLASESSEFGDGGENSVTATAVTLELPVIIMVAQNVAIDIGLNLDLGVGGERETRNNGTTVSVDQTTTEVGLQAGLTTFF